MGYDAAARPSAISEHRQGPQVFDQTIRKRAVELQPVAVCPHPTIKDQIVSIPKGEEVLAGRQWQDVVPCKLRL